MEGLRIFARAVLVLTSGRCHRLNDGRTLWPLWGMVPRHIAWRDRMAGHAGVYRAALPWWLVFYAKAPDRFADLFVVLPLVPFFWLRHRWAYWRWCLEDIGINLGYYWIEEDGGYYCDGRWAGIGEKFPTPEERGRAALAAKGLLA